MSGNQPPPLVDSSTIALDTSNRLTVLATTKQFATLDTQYSTTATSAVSTGTGVTIKCLTGKIEVKGAAVIASDTLSDGVALGIYRSTQGIEEQGAAPDVGDTVAYATYLTNSGSVVQAETGVSFDFIDATAVIGVTYSYYMTINALTGGTATIGSSASPVNEDTIMAENSA